VTPSQRQLRARRGRTVRRIQRLEVSIAIVAIAVSTVVEGDAAVDEVVAMKAVRHRQAPAANRRRPAVNTIFSRLLTTQGRRNP
jgi:hypothetical protein